MLLGRSGKLSKLGLTPPPPFVRHAGQVGNLMMTHHSHLYTMDLIIEGNYSFS